MTLTKEQIRARYFACHLGCDVKLIDEDADEYIEPLISVDYENGGLNQCDLYGQLLLTPLSDITDEHAIEVAKIYSHIPTPGGSINKNSPIDKIRKMLIWHAPHRGDVVDYLRSLGYHTGNFMGYDPIAEGWCILNDKNEQK